jgi:plastocyanin
VSADLSAPRVPAYCAKSQRRYVLDLSGGTAHTANVGVDLTWDLPADDFDLAVTTPWGFAGSDALQPASAPAESTQVTYVPHCTPLLVSAFNHVGLTGSGLSLALEVNPVPEPPTAPLVPGSPAHITAPPNSAAIGFVPPVVAVTEGGSLSFTNADTQTHNVVCALRDPVTGRAVCESAYVNPGATSSVPVQGVATLPPGTYDLLCQLHPQMTATLTVVDTP